jgi:hypothetical protein
LTQLGSGVSIAAVWGEGRKRKSAAVSIDDCEQFCTVAVAARGYISMALTISTLAI